MPATAISRSLACTDAGSLIPTPPPKLPLALAVPASRTPGEKVTPLPVRATLCGDPAALSLIVTLALRLPVADGENVTLIVQFAPAANVLGLAGHVLVWAKSPALVPLITTLVMVSAAVPLLVSVTVCGELVVVSCWSPKLTLVGFRVTAGAWTTPVPLSATLCGLPAALSLTEMLALRDPVAEGVKVTLIVQFAPAVSVLGLMGQVFDWAKSSAFVPVTVMLVMINAAVPLLVSVTDLAALVVPTF